MGSLSPLGIKKGLVSNLYKAVEKLGGLKKLTMEGVMEGLYSC
jgi:hypothetical protein